MTAHTHTSLVEGYYRCDLNLDEIRAYADTLLVVPHGSRPGVVHDPDCSYVSGVCSRGVVWTSGERLSTDRPCNRCLPDGLPITVGASA